jgi:hypothetical protein
MGLGTEEIGYDEFDWNSSGLNHGLLPDLIQQEPPNSSHNPYANSASIPPPFPASVAEDYSTQLPHDWMVQPQLPTASPSTSPTASHQQHNSNHRQFLNYPAQSHSSGSSVHSSGYSSPRTYYSGPSTIVNGGDVGLLALQMQLLLQEQEQARLRLMGGFIMSPNGTGHQMVGGTRGRLNSSGGIGTRDFNNGTNLRSSVEQRPMDPPVVKSHQRVVPSLPQPRIHHSDASTTTSYPSSASPTTVYSSTPSASSSRLHQPLNSHPSPPSLFPNSPRPPVDYSFNALESDLDRFYNDPTEFASAASAVIASSNTSQARSSHNTGVSPSSVVTSPLGGSPGFVDILSDFATLPVRSPGVSNAPSPRDSISNIATASTSTRTSTGSNKPSPTADENQSPTSSSSITTNTTPSFFDTSAFDDVSDDLSKKDPIAAQAWRLISKAKNTLPNGARMENLTWRLMSMTLKKRREETALAEAEAATLLANEIKTKREEEEKEKAEEEEEVDPIAPLRSDRVEEEPNRGRRGRMGASLSKSPSASPEVEE